MVGLITRSVTMAGVLAGCQTGQTMFAPCTVKNGDAWGTDGTYVLHCENGTWKPTMTVAEYLKILHGQRITIAPLPHRPSRSDEHHDDTPPDDVDHVDDHHDVDDRSTSAAAAGGGPGVGGQVPHLRGDRGWHGSGVGG